ncbi:MAG TPA: RsmE family RNA methyltransferase [Spirochaetota bacterium]|nr:RsmE family RNA methyltransferase [Spirochaetota bacterium]
MARIFFITAGDITGKIITLKGNEAAHLRNVLRLKPGDKITCKTCDRKAYTCRLLSVAQAKVTAEIIRKTSLEIKKKVKTGLLLSIPRTKVMNSLIPKCTELGLDFIIPLITERSFLKKTTKFNSERYQRLVREAMKQCGRNCPLHIHPPVKLTQLYSERKKFKKKYQHYQKLFPWENASRRITQGVPADTLLLIGPEGGITHYEADQIKELGFTPLKLTEHILKVETAVLYTLIKYGL